MTVTLDDIQQARERLARYLPPTPLERANGLPEAAGEVWLKLENLNHTRSFKVRGALNAMLCLPEAERTRGVIAASTGNHAQGVAFAARLLGVDARIVMPTTASKRKIAGVKRLGAQAIMHGDSYEEAEAEARRMQREHGFAFVSPYNDPRVVAGAGTVGLEIAEAIPHVARVIVPVGGGGLISGIATALKTLRPGVEIVGVNPTVAPSMIAELNGDPPPLTHDTFADALPGAIETRSITIDIARARVDRWVTVEETAIARAMRWFVAEHGWIAEGGGIVGAAALRENLLPRIDGVTVVVVSGGNVDIGILSMALNTPETVVADAPP